jgi:hypothetical protein
MNLHAILLPSLLFLLALTTGCSSLLPVARSTDESPWDSFAQAKEAFDRIVPFETSRQDLRHLGFDPYQTANITILNYLAIIDKFMPNQNITKEDLGPGLRECIEAKTSCSAYELKLQNIKSKRQGNLFLDLFHFRRQAHQSGWRFTAFIVLVDDLVVYTLWDGTPLIDAEVYRRNPLGPLQEPAQLASDTALLGTM